MHGPITPETEVRELITQMVDELQRFTTYDTKQVTRTYNMMYRVIAHTLYTPVYGTRRIKVDDLSSNHLMLLRGDRIVVPGPDDQAPQDGLRITLRLPASTFGHVDLAFSIMTETGSVVYSVYQSGYSMSSSLWRVLVIGRGVGPPKQSAIAGNRVKDLHVVNTRDLYMLDNEVWKDIYMRSNGPTQIQAEMRKTYRHYSIGADEADQFLYMPRDFALSDSRPAWGELGERERRVMVLVNLPEDVATVGSLDPVEHSKRIVVYTALIPSATEIKQELDRIRMKLPFRYDRYEIRNDDMLLPFFALAAAKLPYRYSRPTAVDMLTALLFENGMTLHSLFRRWIVASSLIVAVRVVMAAAHNPSAISLIAPASSSVPEAERLLSLITGHTMSPSSIYQFLTRFFTKDNADYLMGTMGMGDARYDELMDRYNRIDPSVARQTFLELLSVERAILH